jgi:hypothetical protein
VAPVPLLLLMMAQKIRAYKFWSQIRRGVAHNEALGIATSVHTGCGIYIAVAERVIVADHGTIVT